MCGLFWYSADYKKIECLFKINKTSNAEEKTKTSRVKVDEATMKAAVFQVVKGNQSIRSTTKSFNINHMTLSRWVIKYKEATEKHTLYNVLNQYT